jgi:mRNA-degrading endonuclease RelE of RelBE toxin-antitoxin system
MASYQVQVSKTAQKEIRQLPGNFRQRIIRTLRNLEQAPQPSDSRLLDLADVTIIPPTHAELRRIRMDVWRIIYLLEHDVQLITVLAVRKRPPYQYDDLVDLLTLWQTPPSN